ncbi:MAG TPA: vWA domain-containing protein, partial [Gemmataceae bacterium]
GQDLLFGGGEPAWEKARAALAQAEGLYRKALARAADVSRFLDARDRALAELPYYSRWLARSGPGPGSPAAANAPQGQGPAVRVERLWAALYQGEQDYRAALRAPDSDDALARVRAAAGEIAGSLSAVAAEFDALLGDVAGVNLPGTWHQAEAVLEVPFPDPARRHGVLENRRAVSHRLSDEFFLSSRDFDPQLVSESSARAASNARARRAGEVALAYISGLMDAAAGARESPAEIRTRLETFAAAPAEEGWRSLRKAGVEIGRCLSGLPGRIDRSLGEIRVEAGRADAPGQLEQVDFLARFVDGADAGRVRGDPAGSCRRAWMRPLLLNLARRTWEEHWFDVRESGDPYYRRAGRLYLDDARDMLPDGGGGTDPEEAALRQRVVSASGRLRLVPASARAAAEGFVAATTEPTLALDFRLGPAEGAIVPAGTAAWEVVAEDGLRPAPPAGAPPGSRGLAPVGAKEGAGLGVRLENLLLAGFEEDPPADPGPVEKKVTVRALFRGQWVTAELPVRIYPAPEVTVNHFPRPRRASLAVRASPELLRRYGSGGGAVTIVLDCSGSMGPPEGTAPADSKFARAVNTLAEVLADVPEGTAVSLWVFGQSGGGTGPAQTPEETVRKLLPMTRWDPGMLRPLLARLRGLRTWNESPILHCMFDALADLRRASGYRTMLVLTDGMDNRIDKDPEYNPGGAKDAATLLREHFAGSGVRVHVVGFEVSPEEEKKAAAQFRGLAELDPPGSFTTVKGVDRLRAALRRGLRPELRYWLETDENLPVPGVPAGGLEVGTDGGDRWFSPGLPPGGYQVETQAGGRRDRGVRLGPGDRLLLGLLPADGGVAFERILYSGSDFPHRPAVERGGWRAALLQNQRRGRGVQALVALEKTFDPAETVLQQLWPRDVWFEFDPAGPNAARPRLKWNAAYGYPAPAWNLTTPAWPSPGGDPAKPVVRLWWNPDQEAPVASRLDRGADFRQVTDVRGVTLFVDRRPVTVEGLTVEEHVIDVTPSTRARKKCLVVRLTWPPQEGGGPARPGTVRVRLRGGGFDGSAHWHFAAAGAATALFWRDDGEVPADAVEAVELISLDQFRRDAERRGFSA